MEIGYSARRKEMFHTQTDNVFGICQLGEWDTFNHNNVESYNKRIIDFSKPFPLWLPVLQELSNLFIVSKFTAPEDITNALDLIRLCRNHLVFITVLTPSISKTRKDLVEIKTNSDILLSVENQYCENEVFTDPVSYAIDFLAHAFDEYIDKRDFKPWYDSPLYAFSQSGSAELVVFKLLKSDYDKNDNFQLPEAAAQSVLGKRLAFLYIKSGDDNRIWPKQLTTDTLKKASGNMLFASWCSRGDVSIGKMTWVTAIVSDMDNPNNSYGSCKNKTAFQDGMR